MSGQAGVNTNDTDFLLPFSESPLAWTNPVSIYLVSQCESGTPADRVLSFLGV